MQRPFPSPCEQPNCQTLHGHCQNVKLSTVRHGPAGKQQGRQPSWVADEAAGAWAALTTHCAPLLADCNLSEAQLWGPWANSPAPEADCPPGPAAKLNAFQRLLLVQVLTDLVNRNHIARALNVASTAEATPLSDFLWVSDFQSTLSHGLSSVLHTNYNIQQRAALQI